MSSCNSISRDGNSSFVSCEEGVYKIDREVVLEYEPSTSLVMAVAEIAETDPLEQSPLNDVIDPEALDDLFHGGVESAGSEMDKVSFNYAGYRVTLHRDGEMIIQSRDPSGAECRTDGNV